MLFNIFEDAPLYDRQLDRQSQTVEPFNKIKP